jgi:hypothetical protein
MNAMILLAAVALSGQVSDDRYGDLPATSTPTATSSGASAAEAAFADKATGESKPAEAGLDPSAATEYAGEGPAPDLAPPPTQPVEAPPIAADAKPLSAAASQPPATEAAPPVEGSVLASKGPRPTEVMVTLLKSPESGRLLGVPLSLADVLSNARTRQEQTTLAKAYWNLAANVGEYNLAMIEKRQLAALHAGITAPGAAWAVKSKEYDTRAELARQAAQAAQLQLQKLLGPANHNALPLPADVPHCGRYNTEYAEIFAERPNQTAKQLDELMPLRYEQLRSQARAIVEAHDWLDKVSQVRDPNTDGTGLLQAYDLLSLRRRAFLATARDYNHEIAAYIELAAPSQVTPDRLVAMMIRTSAGDAAQPWQKPDIQQAGAIEPETPPADSADRTAADIKEPADGADDNRILRQVRRPLQRLLGRERSIVVERLQSLRNN